MSHLQIIYSSQPFGFDMDILSSILERARRNNVRDDITGALICRGDLYLQLLEGPAAAVASAYGRIMADDRHIGMVRRLMRETETRLFPGWAMRDDPAEGWVWTLEEINDGALDRATATDFLTVFERVAQTPD